jgi:hypothetical protein
MPLSSSIVKLLVCGDPFATSIAMLNYIMQKKVLKPLILVLIAVVCCVNFVWMSSEFLTSKSIPDELTFQTAPCANQDNITSPLQTLLSPAHILFSLSGNNSGFLSEFQVALKSVLLNAPPSRDLKIHVMADKDAYNSLAGVFNATSLETWILRRQVTIQTYNVEPYLPKWKEKLEDNLPGYITYAHTIGTYFRLFAKDVLSPDVRHVLYMDTDVVIMANLERIWSLVDPESLFQWGSNMCAGFLLLTVHRMDELWEKLKSLREEIKLVGSIDDQVVFRIVNKFFPELVSVLPDEWDLSYADKVWRFAHKIVEKRPKVGMMHFNGGDGEPYFEKHTALINPKRSNTFGLSKYYVGIPWTWARFVAESQIEGKGFKLIIQHRPEDPA